MTGPAYMPGARVRVGASRQPGTVTAAHNDEGEASWTYDVEMDAGYTLSELTDSSLSLGKLPTETEGTDAAT